MAAGRMKSEVTSRSFETSMKNAALCSESVAFARLLKFDAKYNDGREQFEFSCLVDLEIGYAMSSGCNRAELSSKLSVPSLLPVSLLKQQRRYIAEVSLPASAIDSEDSSAALSKKVCVSAAAPRMTEFRRERRHPAGRQCRHHESRAPRRAGSQG